MPAYFADSILMAYSMYLFRSQTHTCSDRNSHLFLFFILFYNLTSSLEFSESASQDALSPF